MNDAYDPLPAAALLADCWRRGTLVTELPPAVRPATLDQGYAVQARLAALLGEPVVGYKLGVGSTLQKRQTGLGHALAGRVLQSALHRPGEDVVWSGAGPVTVEFEVAYVLGRAVAPTDAALVPADCIGEVRVTVELVRSRFVDRVAVGWPSFTADLAACHALVLGDPIDAAALADLARTLVVTVDGVERVRSVTGDDLVDPLGSLTDLLAMARAQGLTLPAGCIVSTGTLSRPFDVAAPGGWIEVRHGAGALGFRLASDAAAWRERHRA